MQGKLLCPRIIATAAACLAAYVVPFDAANGAQTDKIIYAFKGSGGNDGLSPYGGLVVDPKHNLYGVTLFGGGGSCDCGIVYKVAPGGSETVLHVFAGGSDGGYPYEDRLLLDKSDNLYGTTEIGGGTGCGGSGCGTIFRLSPGGTETILYNFTGGNDGGEPLAGLVADKSGTLYGTTDAYGAHAHGTTYELTTGGTLKTLYAFCEQTNCTDGANPEATPTPDKSGNLFGTTDLGGSNGKGTVWKLAADGTETVLYSFCSQQNCADGASPVGSVVDGGSELIGVTPYGGSTACSNGCGVGFEVSTGGGETAVYEFCSQKNCADGDLPHQPPLVSNGGDLFGAATSGGVYGYGVIYKFSPAGKLTVVYNFKGTTSGPDGAAPYGSLYMNSKGRIFGTTVQGGSGYGTVFELKK